MPRRNLPLAALCALAAMATATPVLAQDLFIGTLDVRDDQVVLTRCDLAQNRYVLRDRPGEPEKPVAQLRERLKTENDAEALHRLIAAWEPLKSVA